jgi:hypothetical protein
LTLGLTVGPWRGDRRADRLFVFDDAVCECRDDAALGPVDPMVEIGERFSSYDRLELGDDLARLD